MNRERVLCECSLVGRQRAFIAFSQTDFTEDLKKITVPVFVMHGDDDQIVPYADSAPLSAKLLKNGTLKSVLVDLT
jgi:pimeloyl-ACP methyl ester carboxylesterase